MGRLRGWHPVAVAAAVSGALALAGTAGAHDRRCSIRGLGPAVVSITARNTSCGTARRVLTEWQRVARRDNACVVPDGSTRPAVCRVPGWRCTAYQTVNGHTYPVVCAGHPARRQVRVLLKP